MTDTVGGILRTAMRKIGVLAAGEPLPPDEGDDALEVFQDMVDALTLETLLIPIVSEITAPLVGNTDYTIGIYPSPQPVPLPDNHIETPRPEKIIAAFIRDTANTDYIQEIIDVETFSRISRKTDASRPSRFYVQEGWPLNKIRFESVPYIDETLHLFVVQPLNAILPGLTLTEEINLPPGYRQFLVYNLAALLAPEWGKDVPSSVVAFAVSTKKLIKRGNYRSIVLGMDRAVATQRKGLGTYIIEQGP